MDHLQKFASSLDIATTILLLLLLLGVWVLWNVQKNPANEFNFEEMLRDESGKPQAFRLAIFVQLAVSTWIIMFIVLKTNALDTWMFVTYLGIWSGAKVAETAITAYAGKSLRTEYRQESEQDIDVQGSARNDKYPDRRPRYDYPSRARSDSDKHQEDRDYVDK